jgi:hypothetical protein
MKPIDEGRQLPISIDSSKQLRLEFHIIKAAAHTGDQWLGLWELLEVLTYRLLDPNYFRFRFPGYLGVLRCVYI